MYCDETIHALPRRPCTDPHPQPQWLEASGMSPPQSLLYLLNVGLIFITSFPTSLTLHTLHQYYSFLQDMLITMQNYVIVVVTTLLMLWQPCCCSDHGDHDNGDHVIVCPCCSHQGEDCQAAVVQVPAGRAAPGQLHGPEETDHSPVPCV